MHSRYNRKNGRKSGATRNIRRKIFMGGRDASMWQGPELNKESDQYHVPFDFNDEVFFEEQAEEQAEEAKREQRQANLASYERDPPYDLLDLAQREVYKIFISSKTAPFGHDYRDAMQVYMSMFTHTEDGPIDFINEHLTQELRTLKRQYDSLDDDNIEELERVLIRYCRTVEVVERYQEMMAGLRQQQYEEVINDENMY